METEKFLVQHWSEYEEHEKKPGDKEELGPDGCPIPSVFETFEDAMKQLAADESLSEEARESAKKALEVLVSSELVEIEQTAARRKRAGELKELESEAQFEVKKLETEAAAEVTKLETEAATKRKKAGAMKLLHAAERETARMQRETELGAEQVKFEADISAEVTAATRKEMAEWLGRNRLHLHAEVITAVAGL